MLGTGLGGMAQRHTEKIANLHKRNLWQGEEPLGETLSAPTNSKHQVLAVLRHGDIDILHHTRFPCRSGVWDHNPCRA